MITGYRTLVEETAAWGAGEYKQVVPGFNCPVNNVTPIWTQPCTCQEHQTCPTCDSRPHGGVPPVLSLSLPLREPSSHSLEMAELLCDLVGLASVSFLIFPSCYSLLEDAETGPLVRLGREKASWLSCQEKPTCKVEASGERA